MPIAFGVKHAHISIPIQLKEKTQMNHDWFENGKYWTDVEEMRTSIMRDARVAKTEAQTAEAFQRQLYYFIRQNIGVELNFKQETPIKGGLTHNFGILKNRTSGRGRLDAVVNNLIIEYKKYSKLEKKTDQETAKNQVSDYLQTLFASDAIKYDAILTDGIKISYFAFNDDCVESTSFKTIEAKDIDQIIRAILTNNCKKFVPENILKDFAVNCETESISKKLASELYIKLINSPTKKTEMLFSEWKSLMHLSYDDNGKGSDIEKRRAELSLIFKDNIDATVKEYKALFALQTTYAIIVKLIACKVIDKLEYGTSTKNYSDLTKVTASKLQDFLENLEDGYVYRSSNIINLLEGDFFSWYSAREQWDANLWEAIIEIITCIDKYSTFSFDITYEPVDIFKDLYISIIPKSVRHSMGEYFTPAWLADYVVSEGVKLQNNKDWKAIDPCCGSGTFIIALIKNMVGNITLYNLSDEQKNNMKEKILSSICGIDINPLSVLSARVGYYLALRPFGDIKDIEIPIYLGDSAITPTKEYIDDIPCYTYSVINNKKPFDVILPIGFVEQKDFGKKMASLQAAVKTNNEKILYEMIVEKLSDSEKKSKALIKAIKSMSSDLVELHKNGWDGIWIRIATNFMLIARLQKFDLIAGNPPWVKWEHLPSKYAEKIKELCNVKHIFSTRGRFGGTQLNICALIANVSATNWLKETGVLAFLMPDSIMSQNSYEEFRNFYLDYDSKERLYLQKIDKWEKPLKPFTSDDVVVSQDFNTYYYSKEKIDYKKGIDVVTISRTKNKTDILLNKETSFKKVKKHLLFGKKTAAQISDSTTAFSYLSDVYDFRKIIGESSYEYRTGVEFTPQELYMLVGMGTSSESDHYRFANKKFTRSKYIVNDMPKNGWDLPTEYIYPIVTGPSLTPFKCASKNEYCILPYSSSKTDSPITISEMMKSNVALFEYLLIHQSLIESQSEKSKLMHRGNEFYSLSKIGPYTFSKYIVAIRDNTKFCATVIEPTTTSWGEKKQSICVKHTTIIGRTNIGRYIQKNEAYYISGILNSDIVIQYMQNTFKSNGYSLKKSHFYLPEYDKTNLLHKEICKLAKKASKLNDDAEITKIQLKLSEVYLQLCSSNRAVPYI